MVGADTRVGRWLPVFPKHVCKPNPSSLSITGKSVRILKTKSVPEMHRFRCMLAHIGNQKTCWPKVLETNKRLHVVKYQSKSAFINKTVTSCLIDVDMFIYQSVSIPVENHIF